MDTSDFNPMSRAPMTLAKETMIESSRSALATWVHHLRENPDKVLKVGGAVLSQALYTAEDLLKVYDPEGKSRVGVRGMGVELTRARMTRAAKGNGCRTALGQLRLWAVRDPEKYKHSSPSVCGAKYDDERATAAKAAKFSKEGKK